MPAGSQNRTLLGWLALLFVAIGNVYPQTPIFFIDSIAGAAKFDNRQALDTPLVEPLSVWVHPNGDIYIADGNFVVRRVRGGMASIVAGGGNVIDDSVPVPAKTADLDYPSTVLGTPAGELYISDYNHHRVRRLNADGSIVTVAGTGEAGFSGDGGRATFANLNYPDSLALNSNGQLYIADTSNYRIRRYDPRTHLISTVAGTGDFGYSGDGGQALKAKLGTVGAMALDAGGTLYISDYDHYVIRKITPDGTITTIAGTGKKGFSGDGGLALKAAIGTCLGLAVDQAGDVYVGDATNGRVRRIASNGVITTYAGQQDTENRGVQGIAATKAWLEGPSGLALDAGGNLYITEGRGAFVWRVDARTNIISIVAGTLNPYDGTPAASAPLLRPGSVAADANGNIYIADRGHYRVRKIDASTKLISTVAGDGRHAGSVGATANSLGSDVSLSVDPLGRLLIADSEQQIVARLDPASGVTRTIIDLTADYSEPAAAVADEVGNIYVSDRYYHLIYHFPPGENGVPLAGIESQAGLAGDDGPALQAKLNGPEGLLLDGHNGLLVCDKGNHVVRRIDLVTGVIKRFAGDGINDTNGDGSQAVNGSLQAPVALVQDDGGDIFIADMDANVIRGVVPDGTLITIAGGGNSGYAGDGNPADLSLFDTPRGLALYDQEIYVGDSLNYRLRRIYVLEVQNDLVASPLEFHFRATAGTEAPSGQLLVLESSYVGQTLHWKLGAPDLQGNWLFATYLDGDTPDIILLSVDQTGLAPGTYTATLVVSADGSKDVRIPIELIVDLQSVASTVKLTPAVLSFTAPRDGSATQSLAVSSLGSNALNWNLQLLTDSSWLTLASSGTTPSTLVVTANAAGLEPGTYVAVGYFVADGGGQTLFVATLQVLQPTASLQLDRDIVVFEAIEGATVLPPQPLNIYNSGSADLNWVLEVPPDATWVRADNARGTASGAGPPSSLAIAVDPSGLRTGAYSALVKISAQGALGSPQLLPVRLRVLPGGTAARPIFDKSALVFRGSPGQDFAEQTIRLASTGGTFSYSASPRVDTPKNSWITVTPANGTVASSAQPETVHVRVETAGLAEGVYSGTIDYSFCDPTQPNGCRAGASARQVSVLLILRTGAGAAPMNAKARPRWADCAASKQLLVVPTLINNFSTAVGWPVFLQAQVWDDCGSLVPDSTVIASIPGATAQALTSLGTGMYTASLSPPPTQGAISITVRARRNGLADAQATLSGNLSADVVDSPVLFAGGVVNAASRRNSSLVAPGTRLALTGANLPQNNSDVTVLINGAPVSVISTSSGEIQALAPAHFQGQSRATVIVTAKGVPTAPQALTVVPADPGLYALPDGTTVSAGGTLTVSATGLGEAGADGTLLVQPTAKLDGLDAQVTGVAASSDTPGVYQIQIKVPDGASGTMQLTVAQNGALSNPIPVTVQ